MPTLEPFELTQNDGILVLKPAGPRIDAEAMEEACGECRERMRYDGAQSVVVDLSAVALLDSASIGELVALHVDLAHSAGQIVLAGCSGPMEKLLQVTQLDRLFLQADDVDDAVAELA